jgi:hypothetical protein
VVGIAIEIANERMQGRFPLSGMGLGLAFAITFHDALSMAIGCTFFWLLRRSADGRAWKRTLVDNQEIVAGGVIAGGSIMGIIISLLETLVLK